MNMDMDMPGTFFNVGPFMPHGGCYLWTQSLILLHTLSDGAIGLAYFTIPIILLYFVRRRQDLKFKWIFVLFAAFVMACGTTHLMEIWNIWHADYWLAGFVKAFTALVSVGTTILLVKLRWKSACRSARRNWSKPTAACRRKSPSANGRRRG